MTICNCKCSCSIVSSIVSLVLGVIAAFFQITGAITVTTAFLWVIAGIGVGYLAIMLLTSGFQQQCSPCSCICSAVNALLVGALGSILLAVILLAVGIVATSVVSAILVGLLVACFWLLISSSACLIRELFRCGN